MIHYNCKYKPSPQCCSKESSSYFLPWCRGFMSLTLEVHFPPPILFIAVIPDSLRVTSLPQTLNKVERDSLELKCEVFKSTAQHSHLSISWYRQKAGEPPVEVISLSRDFVLRAGSTYSQRQATGDIRLDKVGETTSKLTVYNLQPSDQGEFYCEAAEWIQDPDESWYAMTRKRSEGTIVHVQATGQYL